MGTNETFPNITPASMVDRRQSGVSQKTNSYDKRNYLDVGLADGQKKKEKRIRLLPMDLDPKSPSYGSPFFFIHQHNVKVPREISESGWKNYICLKKSPIDHSVYGDKCPFCTINEEAWKNGQIETDPIKKKDLLALSYSTRAREGVICRCIDRDFEDEGVKYWKFNISSKEDDPYSQIMNLYESRRNEGLRHGEDVNILDLDRGYDLIVTISEGGENTKGNTISITDARYSSPLTDDVEKKKAWVFDSKKCFDVFRVKDYNYLSIISIGEVPWYDRTSRTWVLKSQTITENAAKGEASDKKIAEARASYSQPVPQQVAPASQPNPFIESLQINNNIVADDLPY